MVLAMSNLPDNVFFVSGANSRSASYRVQCLKCFKHRTIKRRDNAIRSSSGLCISCSNRSRLPTNYQGINILLISKFRTNALIRGKVWDLTLNQLVDLADAQDRKCAFSGMPLVFDQSKNNTASLDRLDNSKGYTIDNVQWVHKDLNMMRGSIQVERFVDLCKKVARNQKKRGS